MERAATATPGQSANTVRSLTALTASCLVCATACANIGAPPGGPLRTTPPTLVEVTPDSGAVNVRDRNVVFTFDVVVSDPASGQNRGLENLFLVSPNEGGGRPRVRWRRSRIEVRPRRDFRPNTAYSVTMLPGISDLQGNTLRTGRTVVFSTGPTIPPYWIHGRAFDWMRERIAPNALIEVIRRPDSLPYVGIADSSGQFAVGPLEEGTYTVRALIDANGNRTLDPNESWDSLAVTVRGSSPFLELLAAPRDTFPPRLLTVSTPDTLTLNASFDRPLDPAAPLTPGSFRLVGSDSARLNIAWVRTAAEVASQRARQDSAAQRARADSVAQRLPPAPPAPAVPRLPAGGAMLSNLKPSRPAPMKDVVIRLDSLTPMRAGNTYVLTAVNARGLLRQTRTSDRTFNVVLPKRDTTVTPTPARRVPAARPPT